MKLIVRFYTLKKSHWVFFWLSEREWFSETEQRKCIEIIFRYFTLLIFNKQYIIPRRNNLDRINKIISFRTLNFSFTWEIWKCSVKLQRCHQPKKKTSIFKFTININEQLFDRLAFNRFHLIISVHINHTY